MPIDLKIPEVGESITEVQIVEWLKHEGDELEADENVAVIDSEKTTFELPAPASGRLVRILRQAGETVTVGEVIAELEPVGESEASRPIPSDERSKRKTPPEHQENREERRKQKSESARGFDEMTDLRRRDSGMAKEAAPETGSEKEADETETTAEDLETRLPPDEEQKPIILSESRSGRTQGSDREEEVVPMTMLRRTVARRLVETRQAMAMVTTFSEADMSAILRLRTQHGEAFENRYQVKLGLMSFFVKSAVDALKQFPKLNAEIRETNIVYHNYFDIGVAISTERGLVVPILRHAERLSFSELEQQIGDFARRARSGKLKPEELEGGTFTITNGGVFGSLLSTPTINPPQAGILGMHAIQERPVALDSQVVVRPMMYMALTYDHRLIDGREAVLFLRRVKEAVEDPARMLVEV